MESVAAVESLHLHDCTRGTCKAVLFTAAAEALLSWVLVPGLNPRYLLWVRLCALVPTGFDPLQWPNA
jgi:hypothetical protein